jgi:hypothetical protein
MSLTSVMGSSSDDWTGPAAFARLTGQLGLPAIEQAWQQVTGRPVPPALGG